LLHSAHAMSDAPAYCKGRGHRLSERFNAVGKGAVEPNVYHPPRLFFLNAVDRVMMRASSSRE
jgi:hypothetical protein